MRNAARLVIVALSALLLALPVSVAGAEPRVDQQLYAAAGQPPSTAPSQPGTTAPSGPTLDPAETEADKAETRQKLVMGIASVVLIGIVVWGRSVRRKKAKAG